MPSAKSKHKKNSKKYQYDAMFPVHIEAPLPQSASIWPSSLQLPPRVKRSNSRHLSRSVVLNICVAGVVLTACLHIQIGYARPPTTPNPVPPTTRTSTVLLGREDSIQETFPQAPIQHNYLRGSISTRIPDEVSIRGNKSSVSSQISTSELELQYRESIFPTDFNETDVKSNRQEPASRLR